MLALIEDAFKLIIWDSPDSSGGEWGKSQWHSSPLGKQRSHPDTFIRNSVYHW